MALVAWRLIGLNFSGRPDTPYWIEKDGRVCDVDAEGWERGVRPGMTRARAQWYYPEGKVLPWNPKQFRDVHEKIQEWLREKMEKFEQPEPWTGWWEQPRLGAEQFEQYMEEFIPHWALRVEAGVAAHLLMARAVLELGLVWNLPLWSGSGFEARVVRPSQESRWWPEIPLTLITGTTEKMKRQWKMRGWKRIGQVPGLQIQLQNLPEIKSTARAETISLQYHWEREAEGGFVEVFTELATRLTEELHQRTAGFERSTTDFAADDKLIRRSPGYHTELATPKFLGLSSTILHFLANSRESRSLRPFARRNERPAELPPSAIPKLFSPFLTTSFWPLLKIHKAHLSEISKDPNTARPPLSDSSLCKLLSKPSCLRSVKEEKIPIAIALVPRI